MQNLILDFKEKYHIEQDDFVKLAVQINKISMDVNDEVLDNILKKGDVVLLKASHGINLTEVVNHLMK